LERWATQIWAPFHMLLAANFRRKKICQLWQQTVLNTTRVFKTEFLVTIFSRCQGSKTPRSTIPILVYILGCQQGMFTPQDWGVNTNPGILPNILLWQLIHFYSASSPGSIPRHRSPRRRSAICKYARWRRHL